MAEHDRKPDGTRSWTVAIVGAIAMVFTFGTPYSYGVFLNPLSKEYGIPKVTLSMVFSIELATFYVTAGILGVVITRLSIRSVLLAAGMLTTFLASSLYIANSVLTLLVVFALLGTALGVVYVSLVSVVPQWFREQRGLATGILFAGNGFSLLVLPPAWRFAFERFGVQRGFLAIILITSIMFLFASFVCRRPPWRQQTSMSVAQIGTWIGRQSRMRSSQLLFLGIGLAFMWYYLLAAYVIDMFVNRGLSESTATLLFGSIGGVSIVSRIGSGAVADRVGNRQTFLGSLCFATLGSFILFSHQIYAIIIAVLFFGIALGGVSTLYVPILMQAYPIDKTTAVIGLSNVVFGVFALGAPPIGTTLTTGTDSYVAVNLLTFLSTLSAIWVIWLGTSLTNS